MANDRYTNMMDPNKALNDIFNEGNICVCGCQRRFVSYDQVKWYVCGHAIKRSCFNDKPQKPYICPGNHPISQLNWYRVARDSDAGTLEIGYHDPPNYEADFFQDIHEPGPSNPINPQDYPSSYKRDWQRPHSRYICSRCETSFRFEEKDRAVWHMQRQLVYHRDCARALCAEQPDVYKVEHFLAKHNRLLQQD